MADVRLDVVATSPHPDDVEITCGGTVAKLVKLGYRVGVVHMTDGEPTPRGSAAQRLAEAEKAAGILGVQAWEVLGLPNRVLMDGPEARYKLATALRRYRPRLLIVPGENTPQRSPDHYQGLLIAEGACFYSQLTKWDERFAGTQPHRVDQLIYVRTRMDRTETAWPATFVVDTTETMEQKLAAVAAYESQFEGERWRRIEHRIRSHDGWVGSMVGFAYGEEFATHQPIPVADPMKLFAAGGQ